MKKWIMPIGLIVVICILAMNMAMPICLADQNRTKIEGRLAVNDEWIYDYDLGELCKGDEIKVAITDMSGDGNIKFTLTNAPAGLKKISAKGLEGIMQLPLCVICADWCPCPSYCLLLFSMPRPIDETTFAFEGEKSFIVPRDGTYYLCMEIEEGKANYKGYIESSGKQEIKLIRPLIKEIK